MTFWRTERLAPHSLFCVCVSELSLWHWRIEVGIFATDEPVGEKKERKGRKPRRLLLPDQGANYG